MNLLQRGENKFHLIPDKTLTFQGTFPIGELDSLFALFKWEPLRQLVASYIDSENNLHGPGHAC